MKNPLPATTENSSHPERKLRKRDKNRIENFVDAVFAIAITLLILDLQVPALVHSNIVLLDFVSQLWPKIVAYILAFFVLAILLNNHHRQFRAIKYADSNLWWINIIFLGLIVFVPFSTSLLSEYGDTLVGVTIFNINMFLAGLLLYFNWAYVNRNPELLKIDVKSKILTYIKYINIAVPIVAIIAMCFAFINPRLSIVAYVLVLLIRLVINRVFAI